MFKVWTEKKAESAEFLLRRDKDLCGDLNEKDPHGFKCFNTWFPSVEMFRKDWEV